MRIIEVSNKRTKLFIPYNSITCVEKRLLKFTGWLLQDKWVVKIFSGLMVIASISFTDETEADDLYYKLKKDMENYNPNEDCGCEYE